MASGMTPDPDDVVEPTIGPGGYFTVAFTVSSRKLRADMGDQEYSDLLADIVRHAVHDRYPDVMIQRLEPDENRDGFAVWG